MLFRSTPDTLRASMLPGQAREGIRPLGGVLPIIPSSTLNDVLLPAEIALRVPLTPLGPDDNLLHEQLFYVDPLTGTLENIGYFNNGISIDRDFPGNINQYQFGPIINGLNLSPQNLNPSGFGPGNYNLITHNCQDYICYITGGGG